MEINLELRDLAYGLRGLGIVKFILHMNVFASLVQITAVSYAKVIAEMKICFLVGAYSSKVLN